MDIEAIEGVDLLTGGFTADYGDRMSGVLNMRTKTHRVQYDELDYHPAERAEHFVLGFEHLFGNGLSLRAGGYHKRMSKLQDEYYSFHDIDEFFPEARDDLVQLSLHGGTSRGIETYLKYDTGNRLSWWFSYVLSEATDDLAEIHYDGILEKKTGDLPRAWDQRHTFNIDVNYRLNDAWHFNVTWKQRTGWPNIDFTVGRLQREDGSFAYYRNAACSAAPGCPPTSVSTSGSTVTSIPRRARSPSSCTSSTCSTTRTSSA